MVMDEEDECRSYRSAGWCDKITSNAETRQSAAYFFPL